MKPHRELHPLRVAWLLSVAPEYWQPLLHEFTRLFPETTVLTAGWPGFLDEFAQSLRVQVVGTRKLLRLKPGGKGYGSSVMVLPLGIIRHLLQLSPQVIFTDGFCLWTVLVLLLKPWQHWRVVIFYAGSSPTVDAQTSSLRLCLRRWLVRLADGFITNHTAAGIYLTEVLEASKQRVFVRPFMISNPQVMLHQISTHNPPKTTDHSLGQPLVFLYVGQLIPRKGLQELLASCLRLREQGCQNYQLIIIGEGEQRQFLTHFCQHYGLEQVQWLGKLAYTELGFYFQLADIFIFPTLEDVWGMVVPEAMSFGKPVFCSQWAGAAELVIPGKNGYIFDPHCPHTLATLMRRFIDHPELVPQFGEQSQKLMQQHTPATAAAFLAEVTMWVFNN